MDAEKILARLNEKLPEREHFSIEEAGVIYEFLRKLACIEVERIKEEIENDNTERAYIRTGKY